MVGIDGSKCLRVPIEVPMRDGAILVADLYAPGDHISGPLPVILERTPYGRRNARAAERHPGVDRPLTPAEVAVHFVSRNFMVVVQDCRGRGDSGGIFVKYLCEGEDGFDTVQWIGSQGWCDGRVVTVGLSYGAHAQAALASLAPRFLAGMFMDCGGFASAYEAGCRQGGAFEMKQVTWALKHIAKSPEALDTGVAEAMFKGLDVQSWLKLWPWPRGKSPLSVVPSYEDYLLKQHEHAKFSDYWRQVGLYAKGYYSQFPDVPSLHMSGWYDPYTATAVDNFCALSAMKTSPTFLVLGPWTHGARSLSYSGDVDFGALSTLEGYFAPNYLEFRERWISDQLGRGSCHSLPTPVSFFLMGGGDGQRTDGGRLSHGGSWVHSLSWPPAEVDLESWYLQPGGGLSPSLSSLPRQFAEYDYDPRLPVPTVGGSITSGEPVMQGGAFDQRWSFVGSNGLVQHVPLEVRDDVVCFESEPLTEDLAVVGRPKMILWISSSTLDTDFVWKLIDVYPPSQSYPAGYAMNISDAILRCRYRNGFEVPEPMEPDAVYSIAIEAPDVANLFCRGHRIRVLITSSNFPRFDLNRNIWPDDGRSRACNVARNRVYFGASTPSRIVLPMWRPD
ncbi:CocE/NonD family hydrolase [Ferrimicrobium sp.]|uniref:CocE/NonD family hydrolase n=1 Tax=Ferrimicrobium sp. TaxID=2926050 RepID=UPI0026398B57|nr:CocE/NonD family hydrolase [Ferrimicrobium sp.]